MSEEHLGPFTTAEKAAEYWLNEKGPTIDKITKHPELLYFYSTVDLPDGTSINVAAVVRDAIRELPRFHQIRFYNMYPPDLREKVALFVAESREPGFEEIGFTDKGEFEKKLRAQLPDEYKELPTATLVLAMRISIYFFGVQNVYMEMTKKIIQLFLEEQEKA